MDKYIKQKQTCRLFKLYAKNFDNFLTLSATTPHKLYCWFANIRLNQFYSYSNTFFATAAHQPNLKRISSIKVKYKTSFFCSSQHVSVWKIRFSSWHPHCAFPTFKRMCCFILSMIFIFIYDFPPFILLATCLSYSMLRKKLLFL